MNDAKSRLPFWIAIAGVLATLAFAWQAVLASSPGATRAASTFVGWIPRAYAIEAVAISALIAIVLHPERVHGRWRSDVAWAGCGALVTIAVMGAMTVGGALAPGLVLSIAATATGTRQAGRGAGRAIAAGIIGVVVQAALMLLVIAALLILAPAAN